jgi:hypothetical protein
MFPSVWQWQKTSAGTVHKMFVPYDVKTLKELFESAFLLELLLSCWNCYGLVSASLSLSLKKEEEPPSLAK